MIIALLLYKKNYVLKCYFSPIDLVYELLGLFIYFMIRMMIMMMRMTHLLFLLLHFLHLKICLGDVLTVKVKSYAADVTI